MTLSILALLALPTAPPSSRPDGPWTAATWLSSTATEPWKALRPDALGANAVPPSVRVEPRRAYQRIDGFGGCFNELGWAALAKASDADRRRVLDALFGDEGCAFALARLPIGASDFATDAYSLDDAPGDLGLRAFSLARDERLLIPFVKAAMAVRPGLRCWGSPWSPPAWMKTNGHYSGGEIRWDQPVLRAYATYLARWVEAYRAKGINVYALTPQNEPNIQSPYPSCLWTGVHLRDFIADYLGPMLRRRKVNVELWLGLNGDPFNGGENANDRLAAVMDDRKASAFLTGVAFQYDSRDQIASARELYPAKKLMQSETECNSGENSWPDAMRLYGLMKRYFDGGAGAYFVWNMVLDETGKGPWNWRQNAPITVDSRTGKVVYNGEYHAMRHFSRFVKTGARRVLSTGAWSDRIAFVNPDGSVVVVAANSDRRPHDFSVDVAGRKASAIRATLPAESINTFVLRP